jgi:hypothetical protein
MFGTVVYVACVVIVDSECYRSQWNINYIFLEGTVAGTRVRTSYIIGLSLVFEDTKCLNALFSDAFRILVSCIK